MTTTTTTRYEVSESQLDMVHRIYDENTKTVFYMAESASEPGTEYRVYFDPIKKVMCCTCRAGQEGFKNAPRKCWHVRASLRHADLLKQARKLEQERQEREAEQEIKAELCTTVEVSPEAKIAAAHERNAVRKAGKETWKAYQSKPFSILR